VYTLFGASGSNYSRVTFDFATNEKHSIGCQTSHTRHVSINKMNKYVFILIVWLIRVQATEGQVTNYQYYIIVNNSIERIDEWKFKYDSLGNFVDSINTNQLFYDKNGDLIEEKTQHENQENWAKEHEVWTSTKILYDNEHNAIKYESYNPYILTSSLINEIIINKCETYNSYRSLITSVITYENGKIESWVSKYFQKDFSELLSERIIFINGIISIKYKIIYKFKK